MMPERKCEVKHNDRWGRRCATEGYKRRNIMKELKTACGTGKIIFTITTIIHIIFPPLTTTTTTTRPSAPRNTHIRTSNLPPPPSPLSPPRLPQHPLLIPAQVQHVGHCATLDPRSTLHPPAIKSPSPPSAGREEAAICITASFISWLQAPVFCSSLMMLRHSEISLRHHQSLLRGEISHVAAIL